MFETKILDGLANKEEAITQGVKYLKEGYPIAFPTETVYGIGAPLFNEDTVRRVFSIKNRPLGNPLAAHISRPEHVELLCDYVPDDFYKLMDKFLPGALSVILPKKSVISDLVTGNINTISIRYPDNEICLNLIDRLGQPLAATSANKTGMPSPNRAEQVTEDLGGLIPLIIDGGKCRYAVESTVLSLAESVPVIFRPGVISQTQIEEVLNKKIYSRDKQVTVYSPKTDLKQFKSGVLIKLFSSYNEIEDYLSKNSEKKLLILGKFDRLLSGNQEERLLKSETLFDNLRYASTSHFDEIVVLFDKVAKSDEVLNHRIKTAVFG